LIDEGRLWYQPGVVPFWNSAARELREPGSRISPSTDNGTAVMMTGMKFEGGAAMLLRFAVLTATVGDAADAGAAVLIAEMRDPLRQNGSRY
jgi:energy-converting hydrogenase Eha subunit H